MPVLSDVRTPGLLAGPAPVTSATRYPESFPLPDGFRSEGIAVRDGLGYFGGRTDGANSAGRLVRTISDPRFDAPSNVVAFHGRLYVPNNHTDLACDVIAVEP